MIVQCPRCTEEFEAEMDGGMCPECGLRYSVTVVWEMPEE
jgi:rRNA maturation endonuclease Nob1